MPTPHLDKILKLSPASAAQQPRNQSGLWVSQGVSGGASRTVSSPTKDFLYADSSGVPVNSGDPVTITAGPYKYAHGKIQAMDSRRVATIDAQVTERQAAKYGIAASETLTVRAKTTNVRAGALPKDLVDSSLATVASASPTSGTKIKKITPDPKKYISTDHNNKPLPRWAVEHQGKPVGQVFQNEHAAHTMSGRIRVGTNYYKKWYFDTNPDTPVASGAGQFGWHRRDEAVAELIKKSTAS